MIRREGKIKSLMRGSYEILALFALIHVGIVMGFGAYAYLTGKVDAQKIDSIAMILRDESPEVEQDSSSDESAAPTASAETSAKKIKEVIESKETERLLAERAATDLKQQQLQLDRARLRLLQDRENFEETKSEYEQQLKLKIEQELSDGFRDKVASISGMKPKLALDALQQMGDAEALKLLVNLKERTRNAILNACKSAQQKKWRDRILAEMGKQPILAGSVQQGDGGQ